MMYRLLTSGSQGMKELKENGNYHMIGGYVGTTIQIHSLSFANQR